jgi:RHS repeat-associated protein
LYDGQTGLVRFGARDYDPVAGRWLSQEPLIIIGEDFSLYNYAFGDPINLSDPTGEFPFIPILLGAVGVYIGLGAGPANAPGPCDPIYPGLDWADYLGVISGQFAGSIVGNSIAKGATTVFAILGGFIGKQVTKGVVKTGVKKSIQSFSDDEAKFPDSCGCPNQ